MKNIKFIGQLVLLLGWLILVSPILSFPQEKRAVKSMPSFTFHKGNSSVNIPFEVDEDGKIYLYVQVNGGKKLRFLLDSGAATLCLIDSQQAKLLNLELKKGYKIIGTGSSLVDAELARDFHITLSGLDLYNIDALVLPMPSKEQDGILGFDFFRNFVIEVNYEKRIINLYDPRIYKKDESSKIVPAKFISRAAYVTAKVTFPNLAPIENAFKVDTGSGAALIFHTPFVNINPLLSKIPSVFENKGLGIGGENKVAYIIAESIEIESSKIEKPLVGLSKEGNGVFATQTGAGTLGARFFRNFKVVFDFPRHRILIKSNEVATPHSKTSLL